MLSPNKNFYLQSLFLDNFHFNFILFVNTGHANFGFIDVQYLQNVFFSTEIGLNGPNNSLTYFAHPMKNSYPHQNSLPQLCPYWDGRFLHYPFNAI